LPRLKAKFGPDRLVIAGEAGTALGLVLFGLARDPIMALAASFVVGGSWIAVLASLNVSAQVASPGWVRGRALAVYVVVFFGSMTVGSVVWGAIAGKAGLPVTHFLAAAGAILAIPATWHWKLQTGEGLDLTPSMHWPEPIVSQAVAADAGPVMVTVDYRINPKDREAFLAALERLEHERKRDGAYAWSVFQESADTGRFLETFLVESWLEHLRQHERVTNADRVLQDRIHRYLREDPVVTHFIAATRGSGPASETLS
jgi:MFS family permease